MRLKEITICGFRGFNKKQTISLDNNIVLIYGLNGSGKSSLVEALEWLFWGDISRREHSSCKSEYMTNYLRNIHYEAEDNPFVEVIVFLRGEKIKIKKELIGITGFKYYINDEEVENLSCLNINLEKSAKPILSQGEIKKFVDTEPKDRWEEISKILGIEIFGKFREELMSLGKKFENDPNYQEAKRERDSVLFPVKPYLTKFSAIVEKESFDYKEAVSLLLSEISKIVSVKFSDVKEAKVILEQKQNEILSKVRKTKGLEFLDIHSPFEEVELNEVIELCYKCKSNIEKLKEVDKNYLRFLELGLTLLQPPKCPFCGEDTITEEKRELIRKEVEENKGILKSLEEFERDLNALKLKRDIILRVNLFIKGRSNISKAIDELKKEEIYKLELQQLSKVIEKYPEIEALRDRALSELDDILGILSKALSKREAYNENLFSEKISILDKVLKDLSGMLSEMIDLVKKVKDGLVLKTRELTSQEKERYQLLNNLLNLLKKIKYLKVTLSYKTKIDLINDTIAMLEQFEKRKAGELLEELSRDIQHYYNKLNPGEPIQFKRIKPTPGVRRQAKLEAEAFGKEINPVTCFSEAHMNSLGLSLYFPQRVDYNPEWEFIMLDDPVQSMDDDHTNQLIDILKEKMETKQIIILTHSSKFREDIETRFAKENLLEYEFTQGDETGPRIELKEGPLKILLQYAKDYASGILEERKMAGNNLRQATEKLLAEFLIKKGQDRSSIYRLKKEDLFKRAKNAGFEEDDLRDLETVLKYADPASHGHDPKDIKTGDILWGVNRIKELAQKYIPEVLK